MNKTPMTLARPAPRALLAALALAACALPARAANDYPTSDRFLFVEACMRQHPGNHFEMVSKCSCTLDKLASQLSFSEFESMQTATNANSIGGERGNSIRDVDLLQKEIRRFRDMQASAKKGCFINVDAK